MRRKTDQPNMNTRIFAKLKNAKLGTNQNSELEANIALEIQPIRFFKSRKILI